MSTRSGAPANVNPATQINQFGVAQVDGSTNLQICGGGSAAQTPVDLGANFPANTLTADIYEVCLYSTPGVNSEMYYRVERLNTGDVASGKVTGTAGTAIPASTTLMTWTTFASNNATALAVGVDICSVYIETDV